MTHASMLYALCALTLLMLAGCATPILSANIGYGPGGVTVRPAVTTIVGGVNLTASP